MTSRLRANELTVSYGDAPVLENLSLDFADGQITVVVGGNACGKSTLLKTLARLLKPKSGSVILDGTPLSKQNTKSVAQKLAILPQSTETPKGMRVVDLVARGRTPHQTPLQQWSARDQKVVEAALDSVGLSEISNQALEDLSGGQRQRAWVGMVLAQEPEILLLDEPTTYLDLKYQIEVLELVRSLQAQRELTVVMVLHDINLAARFADQIVGLKDGNIICQGSVQEVITTENLKSIYGLNAEIVYGSDSSVPVVVPH